MHILIIEAALTGHHSGYLEQIATAYIEASHSVTVTVLQQDGAHPVIDRLKIRFGGAFKAVLLDDVKFEAALHSRFGEPGRELALRRTFGQAYRIVHKTKPVDYVFLPYIDYCLYALGLLGSPFGRTQWGGICMRPSFHYSEFDVVAPAPKMAAVKRQLFLNLLKINSLKYIYTIDELLHRYVVNKNLKLANKIVYLPDPVEVIGAETYYSSRKKLDLKCNDKVILVYGSLDERKGLNELTDFLIKNPSLHSVHLLVAGAVTESFKLCEGFKNILQLVKDGRCLLIDKYVDKLEEQCFFSASDIVWLGYKNHYSMSGVLVLAVKFSKPLIACNEGLIGWYAKIVDNGIIIDIKKEEQLKSAINTLCAMPTSKIKSKNKKIFELHKWSHFTELILK